MTEQTDGGPPSIDDLLRSLSTRRRRYLVYALVTADRWVESSTIARQIVVWENASPELAIEDENKHYEQVLNTLHHIHIPNLAEIGIVEYDPRQGTIRCRDIQSQMLNELLSICAQFDPIDPSLTQ